MKFKYDGGLAVLRRGFFYQEGNQNTPVARSPQHHAEAFQTFSETLLNNENALRSTRNWVNSA